MTSLKSSKDRQILSRERKKLKGQKQINVWLDSDVSNKLQFLLSEVGGNTSAVVSRAIIALHADIIKLQEMENQKTYPDGSTW